MSSNKVINFPPFRFDLLNQRLYNGPDSVALRAKTSAVLRYLLEHPGQLVTKNELLDAVWPETAVTDAVLKVSIRELREALNDDPKQPRFIETAHRSGYRCIAEIRTSNTPIQLTSFIGREAEIAEIKRLFAATRLPTLTGAGGSGKTRLAVRVANDLAEESGDEVWWIDLSPLTDRSLIPQSIASVLGIREQPDKPLVQVLCDALRQKHLALIFDNCEHLLVECAELIRTLLHACPNLKMEFHSRSSLPQLECVC